MNIQRGAIVGLGLMGASMASLITQRYPDTQWWGIEPNPAHAKLIQTQNQQIQVLSQITDLPQTLDLVLICSPIDQIPDNIHALDHHIKSEVLISDIGSIKQGIISQIKPLKSDHYYLPGHPMAGRTHTGPEHSSPDLLKKAVYFLIHENKVPEKIRTSFESWLSGLSFQVTWTSASEHDQLMALTSHFPYLISVLTTLVANNSPIMSTKGIGPGFQGITRLAGSSVDWGTQVCQANAQSLLPLLTELIQSAQTLKAQIQDQEWPQVAAQLEQANQARSKFCPHT